MHGKKLNGSPLKKSAKDEVLLKFDALQRQTKSIYESAIQQVQKIVDDAVAKFQEGFKEVVGVVNELETRFNRTTATHAHNTQALTATQSALNFQTLGLSNVLKEVYLAFDKDAGAEERFDVLSQKGFAAARETFEAAQRQHEEAQAAAAIERAKKAEGNVPQVEEGETRIFGGDATGPDIAPPTAEELREVAP